MVNVSRVKTKAPLKSNITLKNKYVVNGEKGEINLHQGLKPKNNSDVTIKTSKNTDTKVAMRVIRGSKIRVKV